MTTLKLMQASRLRRAASLGFRIAGMCLALIGLYVVGVAAYTVYVLTTSGAPT